MVGPPAGKFVRETLNEAPDNVGALEETPTVKLPAMPLAVRAGAVASPFASVLTVATVPPPVTPGPAANAALAPDPPAVIVYVTLTPATGYVNGVKQAGGF